MKFLAIKIVAVFLFLLSGICGLIYEVAWSKYLALFIGSTGYSHMIVLAIYMGGLALGAFIFGKYSDKVSNQLKLYGLLELGIGVYCLAYPFLIEITGNLFIGMASAFDGSSHRGVLLILKFILSFITLILPTVLMGGTLPILSRFLSKSISDSGKDVAKLYYINSLGAVIGTALAGFFLIRLHGLDNTVWIASSFNILIGLLAILLAKSVKIKTELIPKSHLTPYSPKGGLSNSMIFRCPPLGLEVRQMKIIEFLILRSVLIIDFIMFQLFRKLVLVNRNEICYKIINLCCSNFSTIPAPLLPHFQQSTNEKAGLLVHLRFRKNELTEPACKPEL